MKPENNGGKKDCALLWFTADWRGSLKVQAMTWAEQGMYRHLLDLAWENGGIPADVDELRAILRLRPKEFEAAWRKIGPCFGPHPEDPARLINARMERERAIRGEIQRKRVEASERANRIRWGNRNRSDSDPDRIADGREPHPKRIPPSPSPSPSLPSGPSGPNGTYEPSRSSGQPGDPQQDDSPSAQGPAGPEGPEPAEPAGDAASRSDLWRALRASPYRSNAKSRDRELLEAADRLTAAGITVADLSKLAHKAKRKGTKSPVGLFSHWIGHPEEALKELGKR